MQCFVYKSVTKENHFLYLSKKLDDIKNGKIDETKQLPSALIGMLGQLLFVIEIELDDKKKLANADAKQVLDSINESGFYLQMPKEDIYATEEQYFN